MAKVARNMDGLTFWSVIPDLCWLPRISVRKIRFFVKKRKKKKLWICIFLERTSWVASTPSAAVYHGTHCSPTDHHRPPFHGWPGCADRSDPSSPALSCSTCLFFPCSYAR